MRRGNYYYENISCCECQTHGWNNEDKTYEYFFFPTEEFTKEDAMAQFHPVQKETLKNNRWYPYTAYEYDGETFYSIQYSGIADETQIN